MDRLFKAEFVFSKRIPKFVKDILIDEYVRLRGFACEALNPKYDKWNAEFKSVKIDENDGLIDFGGTEYCKFICQKSREVLREVNATHPSKFIYLDVDEVGDIVAKTKDDSLTVSIILVPYEKT